MGEQSRAVRERWRLRSVPEELAVRYRAEGWWDDATLGEVVAHGLGARAAMEFNVRSQVRPWRGTFGDVDRAARALAGSLRSGGVGPGDVVVIQLPNWVEAGIAFWAAAYLGAVVVPIVHFYGPKEVDYILGHDETGCGRDRRPLRPRRLPRALREPAGGLTRRPVAGGGGHPAADLPAAATAFGSLLDAAPLAGPLRVDPDAPAIVGFTSGTTRDPKGVVHSHRTIGCEARQLDAVLPDRSDHRRSPERRWATSSGCSTPS